MSPRTSSDPLTFSPSDNTKTARSDGLFSFLARLSPTRAECEASGHAAAALATCVRSNFEIDTESTWSRTEVPTISPLPLQPATTARGNA